jgi:hypothetical protein
MENQIKIRYGWLKGMYIYTILGAGLSGLGMILMPKTYTCLICQYRNQSILEF